MSSHEIIMASLANERPERVGYMEMQVDPDAAELIMGRKQFTPIDLADRLNLDAVGVKNVPPVIADRRSIGGRTFTTTGRLVTHEDVDNLVLPDPDDPALYNEGHKLIRLNQGERAVFSKIRLGLAPTMNSMGLEAMSFALYDDPELVGRIMDRFASWQIKVLEHLKEMDFDFFWAADDMAFKTGPLLPPDKFREICLPHMRRVAEHIDRPWVFHSDGNLFDVMDDLLALGMSALHPIEPQAMDISEVKERYGHRICLVGNIDLDTVLARGTVEDVDRAVKKVIEGIGPDGGYIVSSSNTIPSYARPENVVRLGEAVRSYGILAHIR